MVVEAISIIMLPSFSQQTGKGKIYTGENKPVSWCEHLSIHAEMDAMKKIDKKKTHNLLVLRFSSNGKLCESKPCHHCIMKLKKLKINKVYYSKEDENVVCEKIHEMNNKKSSGYRRSK
jgi:deoxycytidylate deaminase